MKTDKNGFIQYTGPLQINFQKIARDGRSDYAMLFGREGEHMITIMFHPIVNEYVIHTENGIAAKWSTLVEVHRYMNISEFRWLRRYWQSRQPLERRYCPFLKK